MSCRLSLLSLQRVILLASLSLTVFAQDDLFITVSSPSGKKAPEAEANGIFTTASSPVATQAVVKAVSLPAVQPKQAVAQSAAPVPIQVPTQETLRDPFWPIGFFPQNWQKKTSVPGELDLDASGWKAAAGKIKINGTSKLGDRTAAIVNGQLKSAGDQVEVLSEGKTYQWQIVGIDAEGRVQLKKLGIR